MVDRNQTCNLLSFGSVRARFSRSEVTNVRMQDESFLSRKLLGNKFPAQVRRFLAATESSTNLRGFQGSFASTKLVSSSILRDHMASQAHLRRATLSAQLLRLSSISRCPSAPPIRRATFSYFTKRCLATSCKPSPNVHIVSSHRYHPPSCC